jgi:serine/threonine protein kinase
MSQPPKKIGRYEVVGEIGRGAMGVVYRARDPLIGREVALKALRISVALSKEESEQFRQRFIREAQSAGILSHPNIVTIHDIVGAADDDLTYIAMEFVAGQTLRHLLSSEEPFSLELAVDLIRQVADGLDYAHSKGVVHRDIKPANILIADGNRAKITDFGIARVNASNLTLDGQLLGTPNYMAPEQIVGNEIDHRADLFSLGVVFYETLTRHKPFPGENLTTVAHRVVYEPFEPAETYLPDLPEEIRQVLRKALEKQPSKRFQRGAEFSLSLKRALEQARGESTSPTVLLPQRPLGSPDLSTMAAVTGSGPDAATLVSEPAPTQAILAPVSLPAAPKPAAPMPAAPMPAAPKKAGVGPVSTAPRKKGVPLTLGVFAVLALVLAGGLGWLWMKGKADPVAPPGPLSVPAQPSQSAPPSEPARSAEYVSAIAEGQRLLIAGYAAAAAAAFAQAERLEPGDPTAQSLREEAERQASRLAASPAPVARTLPRQPPPGQPEPTIAVRPAAANRSPVAAPVPPRPPEPTGPATLAVDFHTEISPGVLTIYVGRDQVYREAFRFSRRSGLRRESIPGELRASRTVTAGDAEIRVIVALQGKPTKVVTLKGKLPGGGERRLKIGVDSTGAVDASLE